MRQESSKLDAGFSKPDNLFCLAYSSSVYLLACVRTSTWFGSLEFWWSENIWATKVWADCLTNLRYCFPSCIIISILLLSHIFTMYTHELRAEYTCCTVLTLAHHYHLYIWGTYSIYGWTILLNAVVPSVCTLLIFAANHGWKAQLHFFWMYLAELIFYTVYFLAPWLLDGSHVHLLLILVFMTCSCSRRQILAHIWSPHKDCHIEPSASIPDALFSGSSNDIDKLP